MKADKAIKLNIKALKLMGNCFRDIAPSSEFTTQPTKVNTNNQEGGQIKLKNQSDFTSN